MSDDTDKIIPKLKQKNNIVCVCHLNSAALTESIWYAKHHPFVTWVVKNRQ